jgi:hypothetical protein
MMGLLDAVVAPYRWMNSSMSTDSVPLLISWFITWLLGSFILVSLALFRACERGGPGFGEESRPGLAIEPDTGIITDCALSMAIGTDNHEAVTGVA